MSFITNSPIKAFLQPGFELQERVHGDLFPDVVLKLCDADGNAVNLSAYSVSIRARMEDHTYQDTPAIFYNRYCSIDSAAGGLIRCAWQASDIEVLRPVTELNLWVTLIDLEYTSYGSEKSLTNINRPKIRIITQ